MPHQIRLAKQRRSCAVSFINCFCLVYLIIGHNLIQQFALHKPNRTKIENTTGSLLGCFARHEPGYSGRKPIRLVNPSAARAQATLLQDLGIKTKVVFRFQNFNLKNSHRMFGYMYEVLNKIYLQKKNYEWIENRVYLIHDLQK